jgi:integrase
MTQDPRTLPPGEYTLAENLRLFVQPAGSRSWRVAYRLHGKRRQIMIGSLKEFDLDAAKSLAREIQAQVAAGKDPVQQRKAARTKATLAAGTTFRGIAEDWFRRYAALRSTSWKQNCRRWLDREILPMIGDRSVAEIETVEVLALLEASERRVGARHANDVRGLVTMIFDHAIARGAARHNVATALQRAIPKPPAKPHPHLTEKQLSAFLRADVDALTPSVLYAIRLLPHLALRIAELCRLEAEDVDLKAAVIRIPAERMKGKREHIVPLSKQTMKFVREALQLRGPSRYLLPGLSARDQPISKSAINRAIERMKLPFPIVPHSFRSTFSTITREHDLGSHDAIELALAHRLGGEVERAYNRAILLQRRRELMQKWSDLLTRMAGEK